MSRELMLHGGAQPATLEQLKVSPTPGATKTHTPIPHGEMVETIKKYAGCEGLSILGESYGLQDGKDKATGLVMPGARMFGLMQIGLPDHAVTTDDFGLMLGLRNSHDKAFAFGLVLGSNVFVCDNLCFSGELSINRKHTGGIRDSVIPAILQGFARLPETAAGQALRIERYKALELETSYANDYFVRCMQAGVYAPNRIQAVVQEFHNPKHEEFREASLWAGFNAITEVLKGTERQEGDVTRRVGGTSIFDLPQTGRTLHAVTDDYARSILGDHETPEPDPAMLEWIRKSETRALALV